MSNNPKSNNAKKVLSVIGNILIWVFVAFSLVVTLLVFSAQNNADGIPSVFGKSLLSVATDSMKPVFKAGDMVIMEKIAPDQVPQLKVGDIITYRSPIDLDGDGRNGDINTHEIIEHNEKEGYFVTKGRNNPIADNQGSLAHTVPYSAVIGTYTGTALPGLGSAIAFLRTSMGFFVCVVLPMILFFLFEVYNFIHVLMTEKAKKNPVRQLDEEAIKRQAIEEYLAKQQAAEAQKAADTAPSEEKSEDNEA